MIALILYLLCSFGLTNIIVREDIFRRIRELIAKYKCLSFISSILQCETCTGFWIGLLLFWLMPFTCGYFYVDIMLSGIISSGWNKLIGLILLKF